MLRSSLERIVMHLGRLFSILALSGLLVACTDDDGPTSPADSETHVDGAVSHGDGVITHPEESPGRVDRKSVV